MIQAFKKVCFMAPDRSVKRALYSEIEVLCSNPDAGNLVVSQISSTHG